MSGEPPPRAAPAPAPAAAPEAARLSLPVAGAAGLCWAGALALLIFGNLRAEAEPLAPQRLLFYALALGAGLLTFAPVERQLGLPGLTVEGAGGAAVLLYTLAFVPAPTGWLLYLPDTPVYVLLLLGTFWTASAAAIPFIYVIGLRLFRSRARQADLRRVRRQARELGLLAAAVLALAGLRVLTWVSLLLLATAIVIAELLFLSQVEAEGT